MHIVYGIVYFLNSISCAALARVRVLTSVLCKVAGKSSANGFIGGSIVNAVIGAMAQSDSVSDEPLDVRDMLVYFWGPDVGSQLSLSNSFFLAP